MTRLLLMLAGLLLAFEAAACQPPRPAPLATEGPTEDATEDAPPLTRVATGHPDWGDDLDPARFPAAHAALLRRAGATPVDSSGDGAACVAR